MSVPRERSTAKRMEQCIISRTSAEGFPSLQRLEMGGSEVQDIRILIETSGFKVSG